jgi:imidazolonepropionase
MPMRPADFILLHARELITCAGGAPRRGSDQSRIDRTRDGALAALDGRIVFAGTSAELARQIEPLPHADIHEVGDHTILPGFVDPHTHAVFAGDRRGELRRRLAGESYAQIAASGGGILETVRATREADESTLAAATICRLDEMLACGTTTCEIKTGYGLTTESELKLLRVIANVGRTHPMSVDATFLGAHEIPPEYRRDRRGYVDLICREMIPAVASERTARWCDVFCEDGVFTAEESRQILEAGQTAGLQSRIHADELGPSGGSLVAARVHARSADHLVFVPPDGIRAMADAGVTATLLPTAAFYLKLSRFAPARELIAAGVPVALATDVNPGGGFSPSMPFTMALACFRMDLTFEEALTASTVNAAWSIDRAAEVGSLEEGKQADAILVRGDAVNLLRIGADAVATVIKRGRLAAGRYPTAPARHESH